MNGPHSTPTADRPLHVVVPLHNEQEVAAELHRRLVAACRTTGRSWQIIYVADGCTDQTIPILQREMGIGDSVRILALSRNFGQQAAILAGLDATAGAAAVVLMDGDLQDPPELIGELVAEWQAGSQVVIAQRRSRREASAWRAWAFRSFHRVFQWMTDLPLPANCGTFCLMDRVAVDAIRALPESDRFFPGLRAWVGFRQTTVPYDRPVRAGGEPKQSFGRLLRYATDAILGYSAKPARLVMLAGALALAAGSLAALVTLIAGLASGWGWGVALGALLAATAVICGVQLLGLGLVAELIQRTYLQTKSRRLYFVAEELAPPAEESLVFRRAG